MKWKYTLPALTLLAACQSSPASLDKSDKSDNLQVSVIQAITGTEEAPRIFSVNASQAKKIDLGNGGSLDFPANAFVDQDGKPVKGNVDVSWQEFHSLGDIMLSGIPMKYDSAGVKFDLVSGGMFTIKASQKGKPVEIAPAKTVNVSIASIQDTPCYNFYEMDESTGKWSYETTKEGEPIKTEPEKQEGKAAPLDLLDVNLSTKNFPELAKMDIVGWKVKRPLRDGEKEVLQKRSTNLRLVKTDSLGLTLEARTAAKQILQYPIEPYTMEMAQAASKVNQAAMKKALAETQAYVADMAAGRVIREIEIDNFGTYNWDIAYKRENSRMLAANFKFPGNVDPQFVTLYLISPEENAVVRYSAAGDSNFSFDPKLKNCLIAILPGNKLVSVSNSEFGKARGLKDGQSCDFTFQDKGITLKSSKDIMNYVNELI